MPDFAANQPAILARLPLRDVLDWLDSRYGSAKNTRDTHHGTTACCSWRVALPCQCLSGLQPAMPITTEKREAYTAGLGCGGPV